MTRLLCFLILISVTTATFAQTDSQQLVTANFKKSYNSGSYHEIFDAFSPEMKKALPIEKTRQFLTDLRNRVGTIENMEYVNKDGSYALYKTKFEKVVMGVNISLYDQNQINGFFIKPYKEASNSKTVNLLGDYPKQIGDLIFSASKDLPNNAQLSIAIVENGKTSFYGIQKLNDTIRPSDNQNQVFEIGSITKVFTASVLASLVEDQKLKLTDDINPLFPFAFKDNIRLSFLTLANHTSGLPRLPQNLDVSNNVNPYKAYGKTEIAEYLKNVMKPDNEPGKAYSYSNLGAGLLGYSLGLSQKTTFQALLQRKMFDKYKMTSSFTSSRNVGNRLIKGVNKNGEEVANWDFDVLFGAGGILSTSADLVKFANAHFDSKNKELDLTRNTTFTINGDTKIGLGWHKLSSATSEDMFWHNGGTGGYSSSIVLKVKERKAVVLLSNVYDINALIDPLANSLLSTASEK